MFLQWARAVCANPGRTVGLWIAGSVWVALWAQHSGQAEHELETVFTADEPYEVARRVEREAFPNLAAQTRTVVVFERASGLTTADHEFIAEVTQRLRSQAPTGAVWRVQSPSAQPFLKPRLVSADGAAALVVVLSDANYLTHRSQEEVRAIERLVRARAPAGLVVEVTGEGGMGRDLNDAGSVAIGRTTWVTVSAVLVILMIVYRAPLAALVPLGAIGLAAYVVMRILDLLAGAGWSIGAGERTFAVVLVFGSGTDFSMFWLARYRESLAGGADRLSAAIEVTQATGPAILASAGTTIAGLSMLVFADFVVSKNSGQVLGIALFCSLAAALVLVPALARLMGSALFWPRETAGGRQGGPVEQSGRRFWTRLGRVVVDRPWLTVGGTVLLMGGPVVRGMRADFKYDGFGVAPRGSSSLRGQLTAERHFPAGALYSWQWYLVLDEAVDEPVLARLSAAVSDAVAAVQGVDDVWSWTWPTGRTAAVRGGKYRTKLRPEEKKDSGGSAGVLDVARRALARPFYVSREGRVLRFEVMQGAPPMSKRAMATFGRVRAEVEAAAEDVLRCGFSLHATGLTPYILNIRAVTDADQRRVTWLVSAVILVILLAWTRRVLLSVVLLGATLGVYFAAIAVTGWLCWAAFGVDGIDWKVRLILFVILVAVGQDYNIFLVSRLMEEHRVYDAKEAVLRAIVLTGSVISGCGLIMAATLGSLMAAGLPFYEQLGIAFAVGVLLDTFVVRPLLVPAVYLILYGRNRVVGR